MTLSLKPLLNWLPRRLGAQLRLLAAVSLTVSITLFGIYTIREQSSQALATMELQARSRARDLALLSEPLMVSDKLDELEALMRNSMEAAHILEVRVTGAQGKTIAHLRRDERQELRALYEPATDLPPSPQAGEPQFRFDPSGQRLTAWQPILSGTVAGWVRVDHDTQALSALRQRIWASTVIACVLASLASIALMSALMRRPLRALHASQAFAADLQRSDGHQLTGIDGPLEMRELAQALNQASTRLFEQRGTIESNLLRLQQQEAALARSNEQLRTIFALSPDALLSIDDHGRVSFANQAFLQLTGLNAEAVVGQPWQRIDEALCQQAQDSNTPAPLARLMAGETSESIQFVLSKPRLTVLHLLARAGQTASVSWLIYMRDMTRESEIDRMKTEFLATAAHELRTPMTGIFSSVELMTAFELPPKRQKDLLGIVSRQSKTMMNIINELLDISRLEARGNSDFNFETVSLTQAVSRAVEDHVPPTGRDAPELMDLDPKVHVDVDCGKLAQVVNNLLSNAYKYSASGPVRVRGLAVRSTARGPEAGFEVEDCGIGMTPEQLSRVTERFYRADASGHVLGTGLGMSIVDNIVTLLGGQLELRSTLGQGTTVTVWLPAVTPPHATAAATPTSPAQAPAPDPATASQAAHSA